MTSMNDDAIAFQCDSQEFEFYVPKFHCKGKPGNFGDGLHERGYVRSGEINRTLQKEDPIPWLFGDQSMQLFDRWYTFDEAFFNDMDVLLLQAKWTYAQLEFQSSNSQVKATFQCDLREKLSEFLAYIRVCTYRFLNRLIKDCHLEVFYQILTKTIKDLSSFSCSVADMPRILFNEGSLNKNSASANLFHAYLDLRWTCIEVLYIVFKLQNFSDSSRVFQQQLSTLLWELHERLSADLIYIACKQFTEVNSNEWILTNPWICTCTSELWLMLQMVYERDKSFYFFIQRLHQEMQEAKSHNPSIPIADFNEIYKLELPFKDTVLPIWLLVHLSRLNHTNSTSHWNSLNVLKTEPSYDIVNRMVQLYLMGNEVNEEKLRGLMGCLYSLCQLWGSNLNLCIILWEYFSRRLDEFPATLGTFESAPYSSPLSWYEHLTLNVEPWKLLNPRYNSYFLFLRLLGYHMELMTSKNQASMKARICVKLHGKKLLELTQLGLYHLVSACLILVLTSEPSDMGAKILEMAESAKLGSLLSVAEMVLLLICVRRGVECHSVAESINANLDRAVRSSNEDASRDEFVNYGHLFIETLGEVALHCRNYNQGAVKLIGPALRNYLKSCGTCHRFSLMEILSNLVRQQRSARSVSTSSNGDVFKSVMNHIYPLAKEKLVQIEYVSFFTEVALASLDTSDANFVPIFKRFCTHENVDPRFSSKFVRTLVSDSSFMVKLAMQTDDYQSILIQSWFRLSYLLPPSAESDPDVEMLTDIIRRLPLVAQMRVRAKVAKNPDFFTEFLQIMSTVHQSIQNHGERTAQRDLLLLFIGPLDKYLSDIVTTWEPAVQVHHILRLSGQLFFHCGNIIYTKGKADCLLALLNNLLLIPIGFYDLSKDLPASVSSGLHQYLPLYLFGLFRLNPVREPYVSRCLTGVFQVYMTRYAPNETHPFTKCWTGLENQPVTESLLPFVHNWFLQYISTSILPLKTAKTSPLLVTSLQWLKHLSTKHDWKMEIMQVVLLPVLELALALDEIPGKKSVTEFLQVAFFGCDPDELSISKRALNELIVRHFAFNSNRLFKLIEVICVLNSGLVCEMLTTLRDQVSATEAKRGTGVDLTLRQHMEKLEITLGIGK